MTECQQDVMNRAMAAVQIAHDIASELTDSREKSLVLTKLDEARLWLLELDTNRRIAEMTASS